MNSFFCASCNAPIPLDCDDAGKCVCGESKVRLLPKKYERWTCVCGGSSDVEIVAGVKTTYVECGCSRRMRRVA